MKQKILFTFDVKEFDLPKEYGIELDKEQHLSIGRHGEVYGYC